MEDMKRSRNPIKNIAIKNSNFNLQWKTQKNILKPETECTFKQIMSFLFLE